MTVTQATSDAIPAPFTAYSVSVGYRGCRRLPDARRRLFWPTTTDVLLFSGAEDLVPLPEPDGVQPETPYSRPSAVRGRRHRPRVEARTRGPNVRHGTTATSIGCSTSRNASSAPQVPNRNGGAGCGPVGWADPRSKFGACLSRAVARAMAVWIWARS
jgi:hypothetical protein